MKVPAQCQRCLKTTIWASFYAALFLTFFKTMVGFSGGSRAMLGSALYSFTDLLSATLVIVGSRISPRPADKDHPYGHGKVEHVISLGIGLIIAISTVSLIALSTLTLWRIDATALPHWIAIWSSLACFFLSMIVYRLVRCAAEQSNSPALEAHAHHVFTDSTSNLVVIVAVLVGEAGFKEADSIIAILEGLQILYECVGMIRAACGHLMDKALPVVQTGAVREFLLRNPAVLDVGDIKGKHVGRGISYDVEVIFEGERSISECNAIVRELERSMAGQVAHLHSVFIHYHPVREV